MQPCLLSYLLEEMTIEEDVKRLLELEVEGEEEAHIEADAILLRHVPKEIEDAYRKIEHRFWYS